MKLFLCLLLGCCCLSCKDDILCGYVKEPVLGLQFGEITVDTLDSYCDFTAMDSSVTIEVLGAKRLARTTSNNFWQGTTYLLPVNLKDTQTTYVIYSGSEVDTIGVTYELNYVHNTDCGYTIKLDSLFFTANTTIEKGALQFSSYSHSEEYFYRYKNRDAINIDFDTLHFYCDYSQDLNGLIYVIE